MSRGVRDLRDLVCVSRLTYRDSDDEDTFLSDDDDAGVRRELGALRLSDNDTSPANAKRLPRQLSPDSGFVTNGSPVDRDSASRDSASRDSSSRDSASREAPTAAAPKPNKKKKKKKSIIGLPPPARHKLPRPAVLPPVSSERFLFEESESRPRVTSEGLVGGGRLPGGRGEEKKKGDFDAMLVYMDATMVAGWLTRANTSLEDLSTFCNQGDNFVQFAHFWLTGFPDTQKQEIYEMEHEILVEEVGLAFAVGKEARKVLRRDVTDLVSALFREYPAKLFSSKGSTLFLDHLDVLSSERAERYKKLLADVRCSTKNRQYAQWLLATRSFALVNMWSAVINFYRNLLGQHGVPPGLPVPALGLCSDNVYQRRLAQAVRLGFADVVHYLVSRGHVDVTKLDAHRRSLLFSAVMHGQPTVVHYLVTRVQSALDVNQVADTGNTALHAAANSGNAEIVEVLCRCPDINVNATNPQCEGATPLHLAVMHGHKKAVEALVAAGADVKLKMGDLTARDIARDFYHADLISLLWS